MIPGCCILALQKPTSRHAQATSEPTGSALKAGLRLGLYERIRPKPVWPRLCSAWLHHNAHRGLISPDPLFFTVHVLARDVARWLHRYRGNSKKMKHGRCSPLKISCQRSSTRYRISASSSFSPSLHHANRNIPAQVCTRKKII